MRNTRQLRSTKPRRVAPGNALTILNPKLAALLQKALDAAKSGDLSLALKYFGDCAAIDPTNKAVLYFGSEAAQRAYFALKFGDPPAPEDKLAQWRHAAYTLTEACHEADPSDPIALHNVGRFIHDDGDDAGAIPWYRQALSLNRAQVETWGNLGTCLYTLGQTVEAESCWSKCVAAEAVNASGSLSQSYVWLRRGDYLRGWKALNARWEDQSFQASYGRPDLGGRMWTGQPLKKGDTLLVHGEQGLGDHVQFARYIPVLVERGIRVVGLETRPPLKRWMEACLPEVPVFVRDVDHLPGFTHHVPLMSLPGLLGMEAVPAPLAPFAWMGREGGTDDERLSTERRVGLIWYGTRGNPIDAQRSLPDHLLASLADIPGVTWVPLQYEKAADVTARAWLGKSVEDQPAYPDVLGMAEIMMGLDAVVAVDTLAAHVAGSLGVPTLLLHRHCREWRWGQSSETTAWYPSMTMLTQEQPGEWGPVLARVRGAL